MLFTLTVWFLVTSTDFCLKYLFILVILLFVYYSLFVYRAMRDQVQRQGVHIQPLPEPQPLNDEQEQLLVQMAEVIRFIGDDLDRDPKFNKLVPMCVFDTLGFHNIPVFAKIAVMLISR